MTYSSACRACLSTSSNGNHPLFTWTEDQQTFLSNILEECTSLPVNEHDGFPNKICSNCYEELHRAYAFKKMCQESYNSLKIWQQSKTEQQQQPENNKYNIDDKSLNENLKDEKETSNYKEDKDNWTEYNCTECTETCLGLRCYWRHMIKVHKKKIKCLQCNLEFKVFKKLIQHKCGDKDSTIIVDSRATSSSSGGAKRPRNQSRTCDICHKTFRFHSNLERHKLIHTGEKPYLCNVCGKGFAQLSYLKIHSYIHTGEKPYKCNVCDKSFGAPGTLMTHIRIHTGERPHVCNICGKNFPQSGYLAAHIRTHTGEKPIECKVCHRRFNQSGRLIIHMRIHSGEKPYTCLECGRSFAVKGTLKKHIRTHTGERPYICSVCGQAFAQNGTLSTHMKIHKTKN